MCEQKGGVLLQTWLLGVSNELIVPKKKNVIVWQNFFAFNEWLVQCLELFVFLLCSSLFFPPHKIPAASNSQLILNVPLFFFFNTFSELQCSMALQSWTTPPENTLWLWLDSLARNSEVLASVHECTSVTLTRTERALSSPAGCVLCGSLPSPPPHARWVVHRRCKARGRKLWWCNCALMGSTMRQWQWSQCFFVSHSNDSVLNSKLSLSYFHKRNPGNWQKTQSAVISMSGL